MTATDVLVLGGYGAFGSRLVRLLAGAPGLAVCVAGRRRESAERLCAAVGAERARASSAPTTVGSVQASACADLHAVGLDRDALPTVESFLRERRPRVVVDATGPFQGRDHRLPELVATHGAHWLDLADAREYVGGIARLGAHAKAHGVLVTSGASTMPALTIAAADHLLDDLDALESISIALSPGLRSPRGRATVRSLLSYCGRSIPAVAGGRAAVRRGWGDLSRLRFPPPVGGRWLSNVDLPEIDLLPARYPGIESVDLKAGLESSVLHLGLSLASAVAARGWLRDLARFEGLARGAAALLQPLGSANGALDVTVRGGREGRRIARHWTLVAERGDGPYVPAAPASVLVKRLCGVPGYAPLEARGAAPCVGLVSLEEVLRELAGKAVRVVQRDEALPPH